MCNYIVRYAKRYGYSVIIRSYADHAPSYSSDIHYLLNRQIDGVILFTNTNFPASLLEAIHSSRIPFVCMNQKPDYAADFITTDNRNAGYLAARYLIRHGHQKLGILGLDCYSGRERYHGFQEACKEYLGNHCKPYVRFFKVSEEQKDFFPVPLTEDSGFQVCAPSALILLDHTTTIRTISHLNTFDMKIPRDLSIVALDDDEIFAALNPPFTVVSPNVKGLGEQAAELLLKRIQRDYSSFPESRLIDAVLMERNSVRHL